MVLLVGAPLLQSETLVEWEGGLFSLAVICVRLCYRGCDGWREAPGVEGWLREHLLDVVSVRGCRGHP